MASAGGGIFHIVDHIIALQQGATIMKLYNFVSLRAMLAIAAMILMLSMTRTASAQPPPTVFDVKAASADDGLAGEYPLTFSAEYDNGVQQNIVMGGDGFQTVAAPPGALNLVAIWWQGIRFPVQSRVLLCLPRFNGGCWCLCLQWTNFFPLPRPRLFWYYNPCC
jgi:hypothetical protein